MKRSHPWHDTPFGRAACWLGSIQLAVPVLALVAAALAWGTYLESTQDAKVARAAVYGSGWFMALMGLVCVSLIFAAITRYPWKLRHVGFLTVHASLVALIAGGFWSLLGRIEGRIALEQGTSSATLEMTDEQLELVEHDAGQFRVLGEIPAPARPGPCQIAGFPIQIVEVWDNVHEEFEITDDGPEPFRAVQIAFGPPTPSEMSTVWIGDEAHGQPHMVDGLKVSVLTADKDWHPPAPTTPTAPAAQQPSGYAFFVAGEKHPIPTAGGEGQDAFPGWKITAIRRFSHASVASGQLSEDPGKPENPAIEIIITNGAGTTERHTAFEQFPDMPMVKALEGTAQSGARLVPPGKTNSGVEETLVVYGQPPAIRLWYTGPDGTTKQLDHDAVLPPEGWAVDLGARKLTVLKHFTKAQEQSKFVRAPSAKDHRPALIVQVGGVGGAAAPPRRSPGRACSRSISPGGSPCCDMGRAPSPSRSRCVWTSSARPTIPARTWPWRTSRT